MPFFLLSWTWLKSTFPAWQCLLKKHAILHRLICCEVQQIYSGDNKFFKGPAAGFHVRIEPVDLLSSPLHGHCLGYCAALPLPIKQHLVRCADA